MHISIGIDLSDEYTAVCVGNGTPMVFSTVICRERTSEKWYIGEEAYRMALSGKAVLTDKLLKLLRKNGTSTVSGVKYTAADLLKEFLKQIFRSIIGNGETDCIDMLVISIHEPEGSMLKAVADIANAAGVRYDRLRVTSHAEAFAHYLLNQEKELYSNTSALFDLSDGKLTYYELKVIRGQRRNSVVIDRFDKEEGFHTDILKSEAGRRLGDSIITAVAREHMEKKIFSSVFLTGRGFRDADWAEEFREYVVKRRKVMLENWIFSIGAKKYAEELVENETLPYRILCDTRLSSEISMKVIAGGRESMLVLAAPGDCWNEVNSHAEFLLYGTEQVDFYVEPAVRRLGVSNQVREISVDLEGFPKRPDRCTRVGIDIAFGSAEDMIIRLQDLGFGEIFPATDTVIRENIRI